MKQVEKEIPLNAIELCKQIGISAPYLNKMIKQGCPYHQMIKGGRKYYHLSEVVDWIYQR